MTELRYSQQQITEEDTAAVVSALRSPWLTQGPKVEEFEEALAKYVGAKYAVAVSSGTAALHLALLSVGDNEHFWTSPLSFVATANAVSLGGNHVDFYDVDSVTGSAMLGKADWALPVHFAGRAAPLIGEPTRTIEDACHALGAIDFDGCSRVGSCKHSLMTCFSFHPVKPITTGEGGAITLNDLGLARALRQLRSHGRDSETGNMVRLGLNYRMTEMQAALGLSQLRRCDEMRDRRAALVVAYYRAIANLRDGGTPRDLWLPEVNDDDEWPTRSWHLYAARITGGRRDEVKAKLNAAGIGAQIHYSPVIPLQPYYRNRYGYKPGDFPNAEAWAAEELSLPLHAGMTEDDVVRVVAELRKALA